MKKIILFTIAFAPCIMSAQTLNIENGFTHTNIKNDNGKECINNGYSISLSIDYWEKKHFSLNSELGYIQSGYYTSFMDWGGNLPTNQSKFKTNDLHFSTTLRGRASFKKFNIYAGVGPKLDYTIYKSDREYAKWVNTNEFANMFGVKVELGFYVNVKKIRYGLKTSYFSNLNTGTFSSNKYATLLSIGYTFHSQD